MKIIHTNNHGFCERLSAYQIMYMRLTNKVRRIVDVTKECTTAERGPEEALVWISFGPTDNDVEFQISILRNGNTNTAFGFYGGTLSQFSLGDVWPINFKECAVRLGKTSDELKALIFESLFFTD